MIGDTGAVDQAILELLRADAALLALCPDGVQFAAAPKAALTFVLVDRDAHENDRSVFGGNAGERFTYLVAATVPSAASETARAAALRIRELLDGSLALAPVGYGLMAPVEELDSVRPGEVVDPQNPDRRVQQWGGRYLVLVQRL